MKTKLKNKLVAKCYADGSGFVLEGENLEGALVATRRPTFEG